METATTVSSELAADYWHTVHSRLSCELNY